MKILAIDGNSILNRAFYGIRALSTKDGRFTNGIYGFMTILMKLRDEVSPDGVAIAFDLKAPTFRHKMYDGYKANRHGMPPELAQQLPVLKELLTTLGYKIVTLEGYEADDILGTVAGMCEDGDEQVTVTHSNLFVIILLFCCHIQKWAKQQLKFILHSALWKNMALSHSK